jgi:hypothetical protein
MKIRKAPEVEWGILRPDPELTPETLHLIEQMKALPSGQRDALLTRAVPRYLHVHEEVGPEAQPTKTQMVICSNDLSNWWGDLIGLP